MITNVNDYLVGIVIGIRYRANFSIEDNLGKIVDKVLYARDSFFNEQFFPLVINDVGEKIFINKENGNSLRINNSNIILEVNVSQEKDDPGYLEIIDHFNKEIVVGVCKDFDIQQYNRIGYIKRYLFKLKELANEFINKTVGETLEGVNDINLRFSKKFPVPDSLVNKELYDYNNAIFNIIKKSDRDEIFMSIDYQKYFDPPIPSYSQMNFLDFIKYVESFNSKNYLDWLNSNYAILK